MKRKKSLKMKRERIKAIGQVKRTNDTICFWKSIIPISSLRKKGEWIKSLKRCQNLLAVVKLNNVEATIKKCRKNFTHFLIF